MKTFSIIHFILLLVLMLAYQCAEAQDRVITMKGDTLRGKLKMLNFGDTPKVQIQAKGEKKITLTMFETREVLLDSEVYHPQKGPLGYSYMKLIKGGYLSLYAYLLQNQNIYEGRMLIKKDGNSIEVPNLTFKRAMRKFLEDCESVSKKIESGDYSKKDLNQIIDDYNSCIEGRSISDKAVVAAAPPVTPPTEIQTKWSQFKDKVTNHADFSGKADALEIMDEVGKKLVKNEKVPNFLMQSLRSSLKDTDLNEEMETLLTEIQKL